MSLKNTVQSNGKASPKEVEKILEKTGLTEQNSLETLKREAEETVKVNVLLTKTKHFLFKSHTGLHDISMQDKAAELIDEWLEKQPKLGI